MTRTTLAIGLTLAATLATPAATAEAAMLGEVTSVSAIGEPLRIEIRAHAPRERIAECIRLRVPSEAGDGVAGLGAGRIASTGHGSQARIVVTDSAPAFEPILRVTLEDVCDARLRRDYTVLLPYPASAPALAAEPETDLDRTVPPPVPAPELPRAAPKRAEPIAPARATPRREKPPARQEPSPERTLATTDRLVLGREEERDPLEASAHVPLATDTAEQREARLVAGIDRSITAHLELMERIRRLEEVQAGLMARFDISAHHPALAPAPEAPAPANVAPPPPVEPQDNSWPWGYFALVAALGAAVLLAPAVRRRKKTAEAPSPAALDPAAAGALAQVPRPDDRRDGAHAQADEALGHAPPAALLDWDLSAPEPGEEDDPILVEEMEVPEAHESAIELAEIMLDFGRVESAAQTLAEFIRSNPRQAVTPWLKLLEVYRIAGLRAEFEALSRQLNKTFNVKTVGWDSFDEARRPSRGVEKAPHLAETVQKLWGTRECQAYLEGLLRDNRDGTRTGFPIALIEEILLLSAILERQLGPYRPREGAPADTRQPQYQDLA